MFDFKFSVGHLFTIMAFVGSVVWTSGQIVARFEQLEQESKIALEIARDNNDRLTKIETILVSDIASLKKLIRNK